LKKTPPSKRTSVINTNNKTLSRKLYRFIVQSLKIILTTDVREEEGNETGVKKMQMVTIFYQHGIRHGVATIYQSRTAWNKG
jgi:hypothetical protein